MSIYEDILRLGFRLPICPYYQQFLNWFQISPAQLTPNSWGLIAAFGSLCHRLGFAPNASSFCELFTLKAVYKTEPCDFHVLSPRQNFGLIKGLSSKISFRPRWCWVLGPGITENPEWKGSQSNIAIKIFAREEEIFQTLKDLLNAGRSWKMSELVEPAALQAAGFALGVGEPEANVLIDSNDSLIASDPSPIASPLPPFDVGTSYAAEGTASGEEWDLELDSLLASTPEMGGSDDPLEPESHDVGEASLSPGSLDEMGPRPRTVRAAALTGAKKKDPSSSAAPDTSAPGSKSAQPPAKKGKIGDGLLVLPVKIPLPTSTTAPQQRGRTGTQDASGSQRQAEVRDTPPPSAPRTLRRTTSNYQPAAPAHKMDNRLFHYYPRPELINVPDTTRGVMTSEDNALAACQAVATSFADDRGHYLCDDDMTINRD
ncbi:hypothetical protein Dimus_033362 [Dionaea muscipula]